ncbi:PREDICTED: rapamycin-insensitive companion of mTOR-like [Priapulus caudatus]|uniref:Rapamycin-insensitive companion of mTOR-like n=1 Tax=Priapulus caudatus TaxID=37621 RepID=A0ABM1DXH3_PRICU|nr:PREDICTED: rapamycin-insensitive companion of mTOR-like [Priapulus caudatus]
MIRLTSSPGGRRWRSFSRRSSVKQELKDVFVPVHLYGQMARHQEGFEELTAQTHVNTMLRTLRHARFSNEQDIIELKAALWALCHLGSTVRGVELLIDRAVIPDVIKLAEECPLYSVRGTCFYGLGLVASTQRGVEVLQQLGWESLSHPRHVAWPVTQSTDMREPSVQDRGLRSRTLSEASSTALSDITTTGGGGVGGGGGGGEQGRQQDTLELPDACFYIGSNNPSPALDGVEYFIDDDVRGYTANGDMIQSRRHGDTSPQFSASFSADGPIFTKDRNYLPRTQTLPAGGVASSGGGGPRATHQRGSTELLARDRVDSAGSSSSGAGRRRRSGVSMLPVDSAAAAAARLHAGGPSHARSASDVVHITYTQPKLGGKPRSESMREDANKGDVNSSNGPRHLDSSSVDSAIYDHSSLTKNRVNGSGVDSATCSNGGALRKPRSDSCGNESTSGVSSSDSIPFSDVAPTPGSTPGSVTSGALSGLTAHPSDVRRKQANLRRKASVMRQMSYSSDNTDITFTSSRDALGYAVLRNLQRHRTSSQTSDMTPAAAMDAGHHQSSMSVLDLVQAKTRSLDTSTSVASIRKLSISSMPEQVAILSRSSSSAIKAQLEPSGGPEYIGLCVPVDVGVIFHDEEEDNLMRSFSTSFTQSLLSDDASLHEADFARQFSKAGSEASTSDGLEYHTSATCLGCLKIYRRHGSLVVTRDSFINRKVDRETAEFLDLPMAADLAEDAADADQQMTASSKDQLDVPQAGSRSHGNSSVTVSIEVVTPRSCASLESSDSGMRRMTVDSHEGRVAIRREVLKYIVNMSSSVAVKSAEQGLLTLKQRFPPAFQDLCLYSELAHLLATCRFRLSARRFLQELFQDATFAELYDDPRALLAIDDDELPSTAEET